MDDNNYYYKLFLPKWCGCRNFLNEILYNSPYHMKMYLKYNLGAFKGMENKFVWLLCGKNIGTAV